MTYSIGMRAPELVDLAPALPDDSTLNAFYEDPDLAADETAPGYISRRAIERARQLVADEQMSVEQIALALGRCVTTTKQWLTPDSVTRNEAEGILAGVTAHRTLNVHGMARIAFDKAQAYVNGRSRALTPDGALVLEKICRSRQLGGPVPDDAEVVELLLWMLETGAFEVSGKI